MTSVGIMASAVVTAATFPVVATSSTEIGTAIGTGTANPIPSPTGVAIGDLLIGVVSVDSGTTSPAASTGWTTLSTTDGTGKMRAFGRIADGTADDTLSIGATADPSQDYCAALVRITGHTVTSGGIATDIRNAIASGTSATPNPALIGSLPSATWLFLAVALIDRTVSLETITAVPASYTQITNLVSSATGTSIAMAVAQRTLAGTSEDPGTFTASASRPWWTITLAIP